MNITDEMLSAFLDAELPAEEMEQVRVALELDDSLVMRMADLSQVDQWVIDNAKQMDNIDVPQKLLFLAQQIDSGTNNNAAQTTNNVVPLTAAKKSGSEGFKLPYSLAAGVAIVAVVGMLTFSSTTPDSLVNPNIAAVLDSTLSGEVKQTSDGTSIKSQLSFVNQSGEMCRQYQLANNHTSSINIACKQVDGWHKKAHSGEQAGAISQDYQTASNQQNLDNVIDQMIVGAPLDRAQEQQAIDENWQVQN